jgi:orotidine-5'-phosphate decarboxylase
VGRGVVLVTPGIRLAEVISDDQKRVATPAAAIAAGADMLVIGRPIRDAADPVLAAQTVVAQVGAAMAGASPNRQ